MKDRTTNTQSFSLKGLSKKKLFNLLQLAVIALMILGMIAFPYTKLTAKPGHDFSLEGTYTWLSYTILYSKIYGTSMNDVIFCIILAITTAMIVVSFLRKSEEKDGIAHTLMAIFLLVYSVLGTVFIGLWPVPNNTRVNIAFTEVLLQCLCVVIVILSVLKRSSIAFPKKAVHFTPKKEATCTTSDVDELKKFKELLDLGIISKEEFENKKNEILGK